MRLLSFIVTLLFVGCIANAGQEHASAQTVSVDFPDEARTTILRNVADIFELNVVIPENLPGHASIQIRQRGWKEIYDEVLKPVGFAYREENGVIHVYDAMPEIRLAPPSATPHPSSAALADKPSSAISPPLWALLGITVVAFVAAGAAALKGRSRAHDSVFSSDRGTAVCIAAFVRFTAVTYLLQLVPALGSLSTYFSIYQRSKELSGGNAGLVGLIATAGIALFELAIGLVLWFSAKRISVWLIASLMSAQFQREPNQTPDPTPMAVTPPAPQEPRQP